VKCKFFCNVVLRRWGTGWFFTRDKIANRSMGVSEKRGTNSMEYGVSSKEKK